MRALQEATPGDTIRMTAYGNDCDSRCAIFEDRVEVLRARELLPLAHLAMHPNGWQFGRDATRRNGFVVRVILAGRHEVLRSPDALGTQPSVFRPQPCDVANRTSRTIASPSDGPGPASSRNSTELRTPQTAIPGVVVARSQTASAGFALTRSSERAAFAPPRRSKATWWTCSGPEVDLSRSPHGAPSCTTPPLSRRLP